MYNNSRGSTTDSSSRGGSGELIVDRIQSALASIRRERDDQHRKKSLSTERLRLTREEKDALEKTVLSLREKVDKLKAQASGQAQKELEDLQASVEKLSQEVQFQHKQLVLKQDKVANLRKTMEQDKQKRGQVIRNGNESIRKLQQHRNNNLNKTNPTATTASFELEFNAETAIDLLKLEMNGDQRLWPLWPGILQQNANEANHRATILRQENAALERILEGYSNSFGLNYNDDDNEDDKLNTLNSNQQNGPTMMMEG